MKKRNDDCTTVKNELGAAKSEARTRVYVPHVFSPPSKMLRYDR
jgi:hypothetical protein